MNSLTNTFVSYLENFVNEEDPVYLSSMFYIVINDTNNEIDVNSSFEEDTALIIACSFNRNDIVELLINKNADLNLKDEIGNTALINAVDNNNIDAINILLNNVNCDINIQNNQGWNALMYAIYNKNIEIIKILLSKNCNTNLQKNDGRTALIDAVEMNNFEIVKLLISYNCDLNIKTKYGNTALIKAIENKNIEIIDLFLLNSECDINIQNNDGWNALMYAIYDNSIDIIKKLINKNCYLDSQNYNGFSCLMLAADNNNIEIVNILLEKNCNINLQNKYGSTALIQAVEFNCIEIVKLLLSTKYNTNMNLLTKEGKSALLLSIELENIDIFLLILSHLIFIEDADCYKCVITAINNGNEIIINYLLSNELISSKSKQICEYSYGNNLISVYVYLHLNGYSFQDNEIFLKYISKSTHIINEFSLSLLTTKQLISYEKACDYDKGAKSGGIALICHSYYIIEDLKLSKSKRLDLWNLLLDASIKKNYLSDDLRLKIINEITNNITIKELKDLAFCKDKYNRRAIDLSNDKVKELMYKHLYFLGRYEILDDRPIHKSMTSIVMKAIDHGLLQIYNEIYNEYNSKDYYELLLFVEKRIGCNDKSDDLKTINETLTIDNFINHCILQYGETRQVVIKFMKNQDQYEREKLFRQQTNSKYIISIYDDFDLNIRHDESHGDDYNKDGYKYGIIMPLADRSLDGIFRNENPSIDDIKLYMKDIGECLKYLHDNQIVHGDIKLLNAVRVGRYIKLIDFDASSSIPYDDMEDNELQPSNYLGAKFSSGVLPPEMIYKLKDEAENNLYTSYWNTTDNWNNVKPNKSKTSKYGYVIKCFREDCIDGLPYSLVKSSVYFDIWSYGVMLYRLLSRQSFLTTTDDDNLINYQQLYSINTYNINSKLDNIVDIDGKDLLSKILQINPTDRLSINDILKHEFFNKNEGKLQKLYENTNKLIDLTMKIYDNTNNIKEVIQVITSKVIDINDIVIHTEHSTKDLLIKLKKTEDVLIRSIYEATEVSVPTCFIIVKDKIDFNNNNNASNENNNKVNDTLDMFNNMMTICNDILIGSINISNIITNTFYSNKMYLYLIDEYTMQPINDRTGLYPIEIDQPNQFIVKFMPFIKTSMKAIQLVNGISGFVNCLGFPTPHLSSTTIDKANSFLNKLDKPTTIDDFYLLQERVIDLYKSESKEADVNTVRGPALRDFENFLLEKDPKRWFSGLSRVHSLEGIACWTLNVELNDIPITKYNDKWLKEKITPKNSKLLETVSFIPSSAKIYPKEDNSDNDMIIKNNDHLSHSNSNTEKCCNIT